MYSAFRAGRPGHALHDGGVGHGSDLRRLHPFLALNQLDLTNLESPNPESLTRQIPFDLPQSAEPLGVPLVLAGPV